MGKWQVQELEKKEYEYLDSYYALRGDFVMRIGVEKRQTYLNQNERKAINEISISEKFNPDTRQSDTRLHVKFGDVLTREELNEILSKRKLSELSEADYRQGRYFEWDEKIRALLSTLHEISPFSNEMKDAIVNFFAPVMKKEHQLTLKKNLFGHFSNITSLFNLCVDKINETYSLSFTLFNLPDKAKQTIVKQLKKDSEKPKIVYEQETITNKIPTLFHQCLNNIKSQIPSYDIGINLKARILK